MLVISGWKLSSQSHQWEQQLTQPAVRCSPPDPVGAEARRGVHRRGGGRGDAVRAALLAAAGRDGARGGLLPPHLPLHGRQRPGEPDGPGRLQHAHRGEDPARFSSQ